MWHCVTRYVVPDMSKDHTVFISRVKHSKKNCTARYTHIVVLCPKCRSRMFLQDIGIHHYTVSEARRPALQDSNLIKGQTYGKRIFFIKFCRCSQHVRQHINFGFVHTCHTLSQQVYEFKGTNINFDSANSWCWDTDKELMYTARYWEEIVKKKEWKWRIFKLMKKVCILIVTSWNAFFLIKWCFLGNLLLSHQN